MPYVLVEDFRGGLDTRRTVVTSVPGTLVELTNGHLTRGGEIEKRRAFVKVCDLPSGTHGLGAASGQIYVFGGAAKSSLTFPSDTPNNLNYIQFLHPDSTPEDMTKMLGVDFFNGKVYGAAQYADGRIYHYWEGQDDSTVTPPNRIDDWFDGRARTSTTLSRPSSGVVAATGTLTVTGGTANPGDNIRLVRVNSVNLFTTAVAHTGVNTTTATAVAAAINGYTSSPNYTATSSGAVVTITAATTGTASNGFVVSVEVEGAATATTANMSGGVDDVITGITVDSVQVMDKSVLWVDGTDTATTFAKKVADEINRTSSAPEWTATAVAGTLNIMAFESGTLHNSKTVSVTTTGGVSATSPAATAGGFTSSTSYTPGKFVRAFKNKMHSLSDSLWHYSTIANPIDWFTPFSSGTGGAGFDNLSNHARGSETLKAMASYFENVAIFGEETIQIWFNDPDPSLLQQVQVLNNTGTIAQNSVVEFGDSDVFYLSRSGIRSLRSRDSSNAAFVGDIGNPIDDLLISAIQSDLNTAKEATAILDPRDGRYLLALGSKVYVFSHFPSSKVSAWSVYEPGFTITDWAYDGRQVLCRAGDALYTLGGEDNDQYDTSAVTVQLPFLDGGRPATSKTFTGLDAVVENDWTVSLGTDPTDINLRADVGTLNKVTYSLARVGLVGHSTHAALRLVCSKTGAAKIGNVAIHYQSDEAG